MNNSQQSSAALIAQKLLEIEAVKLRPEEPFKWASGWNSPIYCDNRLTLSFPEIRGLIKEEFVKLIKKDFSSVEAIAGVATAGIPQGALIADSLKLPFLYVRASAKSHGLENRVEGRVTAGMRVVVVEDLISTGGSSLSAVESLRTSGAEVIGMVSIFSYGFKIAEENFKKAGVKAVYLTDYNTLVREAQLHNYITSDQIESLKAWRENPDKWSA